MRRVASAVVRRLRNEILRTEWRLYFGNAARAYVQMVSSLLSLPIRILMHGKPLSTRLFGQGLLLKEVCLFKRSDLVVRTHLPRLRYLPPFGSFVANVQQLRVRVFLVLC